MKTALLFGSSGFVGSFLLQELLRDPDYGRVIAVARRDLDIKHDKLAVIIGDYDSLPACLEGVRADAAFIAIGTTKKKTPAWSDYYRCDHDYPVRAAALAKERGATSLFLVSAVGASVNSSVFYTRTKGETERDILALDFEHTHIFRPSIIMGERPEHRPLERAMIQVCRVITPLLSGGLKKYRGMEAKDIARAMLLAGKRPAEKTAVYHWEDMDALG